MGWQIWVESGRRSAWRSLKPEQSRQLRSQDWLTRLAQGDWCCHSYERHNQDPHFKFAINKNVVPIIAPLNEPAGFYGEMFGTIKQFWYDPYGNIRFPYGVPSR